MFANSARSLLSVLHLTRAGPVLRCNNYSSAAASLRDFKIDGFVSPPVTPMTPNGDINLELVPKYVQHFVDFKCPNAYVLGTTGEAANLSIAERKAVAEAWIQEGKGRLSKIIIQVGADNLPHSQELASHAQASGADAIACIGPTFFKPDTPESYMDYMCAISEAAPALPFLLYDFHDLTGIKCDVNAFFQVAETRLPNLVGMKYTTTDLSALQAMHEQWPDTNLLMGNDELYLHGLSVGIRRNTVQSYVGNVLDRLRSAFDTGDRETVMREQKRAFLMCNIRRQYGLNIPGATKVILRAMGMEVGSPRLPLARIPDATVQEVKKEMDRIGFFQWAM